MPSLELVEVPAAGRVFTTRRRVRLGDVHPSDRVRVDALARYLQDIARDDSADADLENPMGWVVRRSTLQVTAPPRFQENLELATWCSGIGARWAERRTSVVGEHGGRVDAATVWVHVDPATGRPARLGPGFYDRYGAAAGGRGADVRLTHPAAPPGHAACEAWPFRVTDFDVLGHLNNAAAAAVVEEALDRIGWSWPERAVRVDLEHREPVLAGTPAMLHWVGRPDAGGGGLGIWLTGPQVTLLTAAVTLA